MSAGLAPCLYSFPNLALAKWRRSMRLNKAQVQQTEAAILHAFDRDALRRMLRRQLDEDLDVVAGGDRPAAVGFNPGPWG